MLKGTGRRFRTLFKAFDRAGKKLYFVGGCVRDSLIGAKPKDFDFTTDARPEDTQRILERAGLKPWPLGEKFGTIAVSMGGEQVEITTHRKDMTPGRHPDVAFTDRLELDLERRDFTINSMASGPDGRILDPFGGRRDLKARVLRTTGSPMARFGEDPLRMLRAVRFVSKLGFSLDPTSLAAIRAVAQNIMLVSRERWLEEMGKLLLGGYVAQALELLNTSRLLFFILPEFMAVVHQPAGKLHSKDLWEHTKGVVSQAKPSLIVRWAALLHDMAKPQTRVELGGEVHFFQHELLGAEMSACIGRRLKMSNEMRRAIRGLVYLHQRTASLVRREGEEYVVSRRAVRRLILDCEKNSCDFKDLVDLFEADCTSKFERVHAKVSRQARAIREEVEVMTEEGLRPRPPSGIGQAIMERFGLKPGPEIGQLRGMLEAMFLDGKLSPSDPPGKMMEALEKARKKREQE